MADEPTDEPANIAVHVATKIGRPNYVNRSDNSGQQDPCYLTLSVWVDVPTREVNFDVQFIPGTTVPQLNDIKNALNEAIDQQIMNGGTDIKDDQPRYSLYTVGHGQKPN